MLKFFAAAALIGAALLADGTQAQAGLCRHKNKKCQPVPTACCTAPVVSPCGNSVVVVPSPMVMPTPMAMPKTR